MAFDRREFLLAAAAALGGCAAGRTRRLGTYPGWRPGELDIHFIHAGVGEQTFFLFPDGTTMLLDCGDFYRPEYLLLLRGFVSIPVVRVK